MNDAHSKHLIPEEIIRRKRDGHTLEESEIRDFVARVTTEDVSNEQIAALTMAIWFQGLNMAEQAQLTLAVRDSGSVLSWPDIPGPVLDKHSTGGVGDMVSFAAGPVVAACGGYVPMISGRGLGHTGGTLDKLDSIPGIELEPDLVTFERWVRERGIAIVGQTPELAPADRRLYGVRDSTATVESMPLIVASILGKKLCEGLDGLVMDIKVGNGAFMTEIEEGRQLAADICGVAASTGLPCTAILSDMHQPLSWTAGNALEVREIVDYLAGTRRHPRFHVVASRVAAEMLIIGGLAGDIETAEAMVRKALDSGSAAEKFESMIAGQGGPVGALHNIARTLPRSAISRGVLPDRRAYVQSIDTRTLGLAVIVLGGGRRRMGDHIDPSVGLAEIAAVGEEVGPDRPLAVIHAASDVDWECAAQMVSTAYVLGSEPPSEEQPLILARYTEGENQREIGENDKPRA